METEMENSTITKCFRNCNVFLTGGTGFLGKLLISKLLLTCEVSRIYLLVRKKKSKTSTQRMQELFENPVFDRLKTTIPHYRSHITLIEGDCAKENLGLSDEDEAVLCENIHFVIHSAAAMNMLGSLKMAIRINISGTINLVRLARKMANLKCFCHVSTIGSQFDREIIEEKLYDVHITYEELLNLLKIDHVLAIDKFDTKRIIGSKSTIYALTKAVTEQMFIKEKLQLPVVIFRCSLVTCCWEEPLKGWTDNFYGTNGLIALSLLGVQQTFYGNFIESGDHLPADYTVNALIAAMAFSYYESNETNERKTELSPFVFNYSSSKNPLLIKTVMSYMKQICGEYPRFCSNKSFYILWNFFLHYVPAVLIEITGYVLLGRSVGLLKVHRMANEIVDKFTTINSRFRIIGDNVEKCWKSINEVDKKLYPFDVDNIEWEEFLPVYIQGIRNYSSTEQKYRKVISYSVWVKRVRCFFAILYCMLGLYCLKVVYDWASQIRTQEKSMT